MSSEQEIDYYEASYNGSLFGLQRYFSNFWKQSMLVKSNVVLAVTMAAIEIFEFLATGEIIPLITTADYNYILAWTLYTYLFLFIVKFIDLAWLVFTQWDSQQVGLGTKIVQFLSLWTFCNFLPYGEFFVDLGYKMYATSEQPGTHEMYPVHYAVLAAPTRLKSYKGTIGGHCVLMFNGLLTVFINWILLIVVLIYFTPAIFPVANGTQSQSAYEFYYSIVVLHLVATSWLGTSTILRSVWCKSSYQQQTEAEYMKQY